MSKHPKIVVLGAGSAVFGLTTLATIMRSERLRGAELGLVDIDAPALKTMTDLAERMNREWEAEMTIRATTERTEVLHDADFVIICVQVGPREPLWVQDWRIPLRHGVRQPYAENCGPGGLAHSCRNTPLMLEIARDMERLCPDAWCLNFTNPMQRVCLTWHRYTKIKTVGLCHQLAVGYAMVGAALADRWGLEVPPNMDPHSDYNTWPTMLKVALQAFPRIDIKAAGLNHFTWMMDIRDSATGEDLYPAFRRRFLDEDWTPSALHEFEPMTKEMFRIFDLCPTAGDTHMCEYLAWTHDQATKPWEKYNLKLQTWSMNLIRRADAKAKAKGMAEGTLPLDELRHVPSEGTTEIMEAITFNDNHYHLAVNLPNDGYISNLPDGAIVEVPAIINSYGIQGVAMGALPEAIAELCRREVALTSRVVEASVSGNRTHALQAMLLDPNINDIDTARAILNDFITEQAEWLPQFQ